MMTQKQIKTCQRLGLDCDWIIQNYSYQMTNAGLAVSGAGALGGAAGFGTQHMLKTDVNGVKNHLKEHSKLMDGKSKIALGYQDKKGFTSGIWDTNKNQYIEGTSRRNIFGTRGNIIKKGLNKFTY